MTEPTPTGPTEPAPPDRGSEHARRGDRDRWQKASDTGSLVWGVILLAIGGWIVLRAAGRRAA